MRSPRDGVAGPAAGVRRVFRGARRTLVGRRNGIPSIRRPGRLRGKGVWERYGTPHEGGAEYISV